MFSRRKCWFILFAAAGLAGCAEAPAGPREAAHATVPPIDTAPQPYDAPPGPTDSFGRAYTVIFVMNSTGGGATAMHSRDFEAYATTSGSGPGRQVSVVWAGRSLVDLTLTSQPPRTEPHARLLVRCDGAADGYVRAASLLIESAAAYSAVPTHPSRRALAVAARRFDAAWQRWQTC